MKAGKNFVVEFSTAAYELAKSRILTLLQSRDISTNYTVLEQHGVELSNLKIDSCYKVYNRKNNNQPGNLLKFTINLFHTTNKMTVNGNRVDIFINEIFDSLCSEIQSKFKELNICNNTIQSQLTNLKDCSSTVILQDGKNNPQSMSLQPTTVKSNMESRGKTTSIPSILDATDICSTQTEDKNSQVICPKCEIPVENEGIACDSCDNWYHYVCSNIKEDDLKHYEGSDFHCQQCNDDLLYSEQTNILDERNDNPSEGITSADHELPRYYTDQQIEEENEDNTTPKQIFYELENQHAQNGITIINSSSIPKRGDLNIPPRSQLREQQPQQETCCPKRTVHCSHREDLLETRLKLLESQMVQNMIINSSLINQLSLQVRPLQQNPSSYPSPPYYAQNPYIPFHGQNQVHQHFVPHPVNIQHNQPYSSYPVHNQHHHTSVPYHYNHFNQAYIPHHGQPPQLFTGVHTQARTIPDITQGYRSHPNAFHSQTFQNRTTNMGNPVLRSNHPPQAYHQQQRTPHPNIMTTATASAQQHPKVVPSKIHNVLNYDQLNQQLAGQCSQLPGDISSDQDSVAPQIIHSSHPIVHDQTRHVMSSSTSEKPVHRTNCTTARNNKGSIHRTEVSDKRQQMGHLSFPPKDDNITAEEKNHLFQEMSLNEQPPDQLLQEELLLTERISE
ncbi:unnamed protein product [Mytilus edulis]|uniref:PHD-type domain-containing protein n=1 Tax=Mytilus edulis TaxID=6550 RepID=A0A8S3VMT1_MYTED|nr:unnamed protein product [Mytilus edulis]